MSEANLLFPVDKRCGWWLSDPSVFSYQPGYVSPKRRLPVHRHLDPGANLTGVVPPWFGPHAAFASLVPSLSWVTPEVVVPSLSLFPALLSDSPHATFLLVIPHTSFHFLPVDLSIGAVAFVAASAYVRGGVGTSSRLSTDSIRVSLVLT